MSEADGAATAAAAADSSQSKKKVAAPSEKEHNAKVQALTAEIESLQAELDSLKLPPKGEGEAKPKTPQQQARDALFQDLSKVKAEHEAKMAEKKALSDQLDKLNKNVKSEVEKTQKSRPTRYRTSEEVDRAIAQLEEQLRTHHYALIEEKRIVGEIDALKRSKKDLVAHAAARDALSAKYQNSKELRGQISALHEEISTLRNREKDIKRELDKTKGTGESDAKKRSQRFKEVKAKLDAAYAARREEHQTYHAQKQAWWESTKEEREAAKQRKAEERRRQQEEKRQIAEAKRKAFEEWEASRHPWEDHMAKCDLLVAYLQPLVPKQSSDTSSSDKQSTTASLGDTSQFKDGAFLRKKDDVADEFFMGGGKKGKKGGKKGGGAPKAKKMAHTPVVIADFAFVGIKPPATTTEAAATLQEIIDKKAFYETAPRPEKKQSKRPAAEKKKKAEDEEQEEQEQEQENNNGGLDEQEVADMAEYEAQVAELEAQEAAEAAAAAAAATAAAAASKQPASAAAAPSSAEVPLPPPHLRVYADDSALGKSAPSLETLVYVKGEPVQLGGGKNTLVLFWAKFAKGDYGTVCSVSDLQAQFPELQVVGISADPEQEQVESFVKKLGTAMPEINVPELKADFALAYDPDKKVKTAFQKATGLVSVGASACFLVDGSGTIVWREQFSQGHLLEKGQITEQTRRLLAGEPLLSNGPRPKDDDDSDDESDMDMGGPDSDDEDGLLF